MLVSDVRSSRADKTATIVGFAIGVSGMFPPLRPTEPRVAGIRVKRWWPAALTRQRLEDHNPAMAERSLHRIRMPLCSRTKSPLSTGANFEYVSGAAERRKYDTRPRAPVPLEVITKARQTGTASTRDTSLRSISYPSARKRPHSWHTDALGGGDSFRFERTPLIEVSVVWSFCIIW